MITKDLVHRAVVENNDRSIKCRIHSGKLKGGIYRGVFERDIKRYLQKKQLRVAVNAGWLIRQKIKWDSGEHRNVYVWPYQEMTPFSFWERLLRRIKNLYKRWIKGEKV